jgi:predicted kinase
VTADPPGNEPTRATLIYLYGPPASGKLTVATRLSELTGIPLFHNHLTVNAVRPIFGFGTPAFTEAVHAMRRGVFTAAARAGVSLIFTNNSAWFGPDPRARFEAAAEGARQIMVSHGGSTIFVQLIASPSTLEERVGNDSRRAQDKLVDVGRLHEQLATFDASPLHPDDLTIDTERTGPDESARIIAAALVPLSQPGGARG